MKLEEMKARLQKLEETIKQTEMLYHQMIGRKNELKDLIEAMEKESK